MRRIIAILAAVVISVAGLAPAAHAVKFKHHDDIKYHTTVKF